MFGLESSTGSGCFSLDVRDEASLHLLHPPNVKSPVSLNGALHISLQPISIVKCKMESVRFFLHLGLWKNTIKQG